MKSPGAAWWGGVAGGGGPGLQPVGPRRGWGRPALPTAGVSAAGLPSPSRLQVAQGASWVPAGAAVPIPSKHYSAQTPAVAGGRGVPSQGGWRVLPLPATHPSCSRGGGPCRGPSPIPQGASPPFTSRSLDRLPLLHLTPANSHATCVCAHSPALPALQREMGRAWPLAPWRCPKACQFCQATGVMPAVPASAQAQGATGLRPTATAAASAHPAQVAGLLRADPTGCPAPPACTRGQPTTPGSWHRAGCPGCLASNRGPDTH